MVGKNIGQSWSADDYWKSVKNDIPKENIELLKDASKVSYFNLKKLIKDL